MKTLCQMLLLLLCCSYPALTQQDGLSSQPSAQPQSAAQERSRVLVHRTPREATQAKVEGQQVALSVVVQDASGRPVGNLGQQDFIIQDQNRTQPIASFQAVEGLNVKPTVELILVLDTVNATFQGVSLARQGVEKYLRQNAGHLPLPVSIIYFTDSGVKLNHASRDGNALADDMAKLPTQMRMMGPAQGFGGLMNRFKESIRALTEVSTYEATKPGRKLLVWIGPGWPLLSGQAFAMSAKDRQAIFNSVVELSTNLRRARLTLYSVAPLDLSIGNQMRTFIYQTFLKGVETPTQADSGNLAVQVLAVQSGGRTFDPSGDIAQDISRSAEDATAFYEMSFHSMAGRNADEYHSLAIKLNQAGLTARTNTAYYAQP